MNIIKKRLPVSRMTTALLGGFLFAATMLSGAAWAKEDAVYTKLFGDAAGGYDVTAYFSEARPVKGKKAFKTDYQGATWLFANQKNLDKFTAEPEKYAPQYGGYCAYAVAIGDTASGDPELWTIHDDKLYLNYNAKINAKWRADIDQFIVDADQNWPAVLK